MILAAETCEHGQKIWTFIPNYIRKLNATKRQIFHLSSFLNLILTTHFQVIYILLSMSSSISYNNALLLLKKSLK